MSQYAIGDVQGCFKQLQDLLTEIRFDPKHDRLWFTGDIVNRGPDSLAVVRFIKSLPNQPVVVLGNHDLHLLALHSGNAVLKKQDTLQEILAAPDCQELCEWLRQQPVLHHDPETGYLMVHAGLAPQWDLATALACAQELQTVLRGNNYREFLKNMYGNEPTWWNNNLTGWDRLRFITNCLTRLRFCHQDGNIDLTIKGNVGSQPDHFIPWFKFPNRASHTLKIIFGHWAALGGQCDEPNVYPIDTGCAWGNCLTAMRLDDGKRFSVPCNK